MISVLVSRDVQSGQVTLERVVEWTARAEMEAAQAELDALRCELSERYAASREVFAASARSLESFVNAWPEYAGVRA